MPRNKYHKCSGAFLYIKYPVHNIIIHIIPVTNREITFSQLSHSHVLVKLQSLIITIYIELHQTRFRVYFFDTLDCFLE